MTGTTRWTPSLISIGAILAGCFFALPVQLVAQNTSSGVQGQNGVYNATCNNGNLGIVGSAAFIDASRFAGAAPDICGVLSAILSGTTGIPFPAAGAVIDARGLNPNNTSMTCTGTPWSGITNPPPSTILLPTGTIVIPSTWTLPTGTHLVGVGDGIGSGTTIQSTATFSTNHGGWLTHSLLPTIR